ncbi:MAG: DUF1697 domain-containing protein [Opitutaceae bacterium]|jgi:uncharacterized protein (DUF1697 family)|nr:DUF1697 domain-containing protein [Opitutaceae bacterium]
MPHYVAFLRGINLGKRRVKMNHLRDLFTAMGHENVSTYIASGNVVFTSATRSIAKLENHIEQVLESELGYAVPIIIRTQTELCRIVSNAPLSDLFIDAEKPSTQVTFFKNAIEPQLAKTLGTLRTPTDAFASTEQELYWRCAIRISESTIWKHPKLNPHHIPTGTTRNLNTLQKLVDLFAS